MKSKPPCWRRARGWIEMVNAHGPVPSTKFFLAFLCLLSSGQFAYGSNGGDQIAAEEHVLDELVAVHAAGVAGPMTSTATGHYLYAAEGGMVAMIDADRKAKGNANYATPIWRAALGSLGAKPVQLLLDPEITIQQGDEEDGNAFLYVAAGRDGLWVMHAGRSSDQIEIQSYRVDDSQDLDPHTQDSRRWCNDLAVMSLDGDNYLLALFAELDGSRLRVYRMASLRSLAGSGNELGSEVAPDLEVLLGRNDSSVSKGEGTGPKGGAFAYGLAVDEDEGDVYVAMGEHGLIKLHLDVAGTELSSSPVLDGPFFGAGSPYEFHSKIGKRTLYGSVDYFDEHSGERVFSHSPYFLDVAVENVAGRHRLYAAVGILGWCAFDLDAPWAPEIWTRSASPPGFPAFLQEGKRVQIMGAPNTQQPNQLKDQIVVLDDPRTKGDLFRTSVRHVQVVDTSGPNQQGSTLVVSMAGHRFLSHPGTMNEGRLLQYDLTLGAAPGGSYPAASSNQKYVAVAYELEGSDFRTGARPWKPGARNMMGLSPVGYDLWVPPVQSQGQLSFFSGPFAEQSIVPSRLARPIYPVTPNHLIRSTFSTWPPLDGPALPDSYMARDRFYRLGRLGINVFPSKIDPDLLITSKNDGLVVPDGNPVFDPKRSTISTPMAVPGMKRLGKNRTALVPGLRRPGDRVPHPKTERLDFGITTAPGGGWVGDLTDPKWEYRLGWMSHEIGQGHTPNINGRASRRSKAFYQYQWVINKFQPIYGGQDGAISDLRVTNQLHITPPANKFSPLPYSESTMGGGSDGEFTAYYQQNWSGLVYYGESETFEGYNAYIAKHYGADVDARGILFAAVNGSPQGIWAFGLSALEGLLNAKQPALEQNSLLLADTLPHPSSPSQAHALGGLVTHPEYWNVPDARTAYNDPKTVPGEFFISGVREPKGTAPSHPGTLDHAASVHIWDMEMLRLKDQQGNERWILAAACGFSVLSELDPALTESGWAPDPEFRTDGGHRHMLVRLFDVTDPRQLRGVLGQGQLSASADNLDSPDIRAWTLLGPDVGTSANFVKWIHTRDNTAGGGSERDLLLVTDLGGKVYLYDLADLFDVKPSPRHASEPTGSHFGGFFKLANSPALIPPYETQLSVSDKHASAIFGCEVVQETWLANGQKRDATYVYLGVPRLGVEVLKLGFAPGERLPTLDYIGRIQTPGNASRLHVERFPRDASNYPEALLYLADYEGGIRIYRHGASPTGLPTSPREPSLERSRDGGRAASILSSGLGQ